jgi:putative ubiquitin-RnfH superfamily antitoxin RatB of RatAB toxin-antitoxin module
MSGVGNGDCQVVFAAPAWQETVTVPVLPGTTVSAALQAARLALAQRSPTHAQAIPWDSAAVGIHGRVCTRDALVAAGDRVEIYRPLQVDPREERRRRARRGGNSRKTQP